MRMSCNGCRVLRKGCSDDCTIRPCLQWIKSPESQANATLFLAKFYGRAGLVNLIRATPLHLRPATFWSLLYEACGRVVCPVYGSTGLLGSGNWAQCQAAVDSVLKGLPIGSSQVTPPPPMALDIRHVSQDHTNCSKVHRVISRPRFKHPSSPVTSNYMSLGRPKSPMGLCNRSNRLSVQMSGFEQIDVSSSKEDRESLFSVETVEGSLVKRVEPDRVQSPSVDLELTLGITPI